MWLRAKLSCFSSPKPIPSTNETITHETESRLVTESPSHQVTESPSHRVADVHADVGEVLEGEKLLDTLVGDVGEPTEEEPL